MDVLLIKTARLTRFLCGLLVLFVVNPRRILIYLTRTFLKKSGIVKSLVK